MVALWELDEDNRKKGVKIARFEGCVTEKFPVYLTLKRTPEERVYVDGKNKPIAYNYTSQETTVANDVKDKFPLKITEDGGERLPENLMVNFTVATTRENIQPKETLGTTFGKIKKWFSDLKALAFKENVAKEDLADDLKKELDAKADKTGNIASATKATQDSAGQQINTTYIKGLGINGKVITYTKGNGTTGTITTQDTTYNEATPTSAGLLSADDKKKMNLLSNHQQVFASYAVRLASHGTYGFIPVGDKWVSNNYGVNKGVAETTWKIYSLSAQTVTFKYRVISEASCDKLTITVNGTVSVNAVSGQGNETSLSVTLNVGENTLVAKYAKDSSANSHFDCAYLWFGNISAAETSQTAISANKASQDESGNNIKGSYAAGISISGHTITLKNKNGASLGTVTVPDNDTVYIHPTGAGNNHIPPGGSSGQYLKYSSAGAAAWASPDSNLATTSAAGFMSADDKKKVDGAYIYYMAKVRIPTASSTETQQVYNPSGVTAKFTIEKISEGYYCCKVAVGKPSGYSYVKPLILGESTGCPYITGNQGYGSFVVRTFDRNGKDAIIGSTFTIVLIAHN